MNSFFAFALIIALCCLHLIISSCSPNNKAPIQKDISKSFFRDEWEQDFNKYTTDLTDASDTMPGDQGVIRNIIEGKILKIKQYQVLEQWVDSIAHHGSIIIRIINNNIQYDFGIKNSKVHAEINPRNGPNDNHILYFLDGKEFPAIIPDTADCFWLVKNADNVLHIIYLNPKGTVKDEIVSFDNTIEAALQTVNLWKVSRQISIPYEKKYGTIVSYWDKENSYHVFLPWMWNDDDCENGWQCVTKDSTVNKYHSALLNILCMSKQKGVLKQH